MATRRMRIKAVIKVGRGPKQEDVTVGASVDPPSFSPGPPQSPKIGVPASPVPPRVNTPPILIPASPQSPTTSGTSLIQRPSPSKSPACLPPTGSILRRSPSPALSRLTTSPGPPTSPIKSPVPYGSPLSPTKYGRSSALVLSHFSDPQIDTYHVKSPVAHVFRPPPSPSPSFQEYQGVKSPQVISRPSPSQSPLSRPSPSPSPSAGFLAHHFNSNSNSLDSNEVAQFMAPSSPAGLYPPDKRGRDSACTEINFPGHSVFGNLNAPSPSFSKTIFDNPEMLKKRAEENRKKEQVQGTATKFALARKDFYEKLQAGQLPERNKLTMLHFTFYNPPDPNKPKEPPKKSRSRASSVCSDVSVVSVVSKHENDNFLVPPTNENLRKAFSAPSSIAGSRRTTASSVGSAGSNPRSDEGQSDGVKPGPRVKVGPDGQLIIDEQSLVMETSESQRARQQIEDMEVVSGAEYAVGSSGFFRYKKNFRRGSNWTERETLRFYKALVQCGTDFSMMQKYFPHRTRQELKSKFKREDRKFPDLISTVLQNCVFDPDEGISSEDEEKDMEKEVVGCVGGELQLQLEPKKKKLKVVKQKEIEFTKEQLDEMKGTIVKGKGTGKGRKWNTPVEGLVGGKLPPLKEVKLEEVEVKKKKNSVKKKPLPPVTPGMGPIIVAGGIFRETTSLGTVKMEKEVEKGCQKVVTGAGTGEGGGRRNRAKLKPNVKGIRRKSGEGDIVIGDSSQPKKVVGVCDELFRFDASDPAGLKVVPAILLPAAETVLEGNEEGSEDLVLVDLDELNRIQKGSEGEAVPPKKRKWRKNEGAVMVKLANTSKDPYVISSTGKEPVPSTSTEAGPSKKVKALPFRVPGPGGLLPPSQPAPSSELVLEINFNES